MYEGKLEILLNPIRSFNSDPYFRVQDHAVSPRLPTDIQALQKSYSRLFHSFHNSRTAYGSEDWFKNWKSRSKPLFTHLTARSIYSAACLNLCRSCGPLRSSRPSAAQLCDACRQTAAQSPAMMLRSNAWPTTLQSPADRQSRENYSSP